MTIRYIKIQTAQFEVPDRGDAANKLAETIAYVHDSKLCQDTECSICGVLACPYMEPLHFHHDGCPACYLAPEGTPAIGQEHDGNPQEAG